MWEWCFVEFINFGGKLIVVHTVICFSDSLATTSTEGTCLNNSLPLYIFSLFLHVVLSDHIIVHLLFYLRFSYID